MADEIIKGKTAESAEIPQEMAKEVMDAALAGVKAGTSDVVTPAEGGGNVLKGDSVADNFRGLPMRELISAPLIAAAKRSNSWLRPHGNSTRKSHSRRKRAIRVAARRAYWNLR